MAVSIFLQMKFIEKQQSFKKILQRATGKISLFFA